MSTSTPTGDFFCRHGIEAAVCAICGPPHVRPEHYTLETKLDRIIELLEMMYTEGIKVHQR